jgi:hypothetical protein
MSVRALLSNCCVDDTRPSKVNNKVTRYMERKADNVGGKSMIDVKYERINGKTYGTFLGKADVSSFSALNRTILFCF